MNAFESALLDNASRILKSELDLVEQVFRENDEVVSLLTWTETKGSQITLRVCPFAVQLTTDIVEQTSFALDVSVKQFRYYQRPIH
jgi:hypothetical protein